MPWSAKAQELLRSQYAAVGRWPGMPPYLVPRPCWTRLGSGSMAKRKEQLAAVQSNFLCSKANIERFVSAYRQYCWPVDSLDDLKLAPFHLLATEAGRSHAAEITSGNMERLRKICEHDSKLLLATQFKVVDVTSPDSEKAGIALVGRTDRAGGRRNGC